MISELMANTASPDPQISGAWIISVITTLGGIILGLWGKKQHDRAKAAETETIIKGQPIGVVKHQQAVTWADHINLVRRVDRVEAHYDELRKDASEQFKDLLEAASSRESRIIKELHEVARSIHDRIDKITQPRGGAK